MVESKFAGLVRNAALTPTPTPVERVEKRSSPAKPARTTMSYRPTVEDYQTLRKAAFDGDRKMQDILDEAFREWKERHLDS